MEAEALCALVNLFNGLNSFQQYTSSNLVEKIKKYNFFLDAETLTTCNVLREQTKYTKYNRNFQLENKHL